jgi:ankyrin repeat protein
MVRCLLDRACGRALLEATNERGERPLHVACSHGSLELVLLLVEEYRANVQAQDQKGETPLDKAQAKHRDDVVTYLQGLANRAAESATLPPPDTRTAAVAVASAGIGAVSPSNVVEMPHDEETMWWNREQRQADRADETLGVIVLEANDNYALLKAAEAGKVETVSSLVRQVGRRGVAQARDGQEHTALHLASSGNHYDTVRYLVRVCRVPVDAQTVPGGLTPLHIATQVDNLEIVRYLVHEGQANVEAVEMNGRTALHLASTIGYLELVQFLVDECEANFLAEDTEGATPLSLARDHGNMDVVQYLESKLVPQLASRNEQEREKVSQDRQAMPEVALPAEHRGAISQDVDTDTVDAQTVRSLLESIDAQNQRITEYFSRRELENDAQDGRGSPLRLSNREQDILSLMIGDVCKSQDDEEEKRAILANRAHKEFYLHLARKLYCMIRTFEVLSTKMVERKQSYTDELLEQAGPELIKGTNVGKIVTAIIGFGRRNGACVPLLDCAGSICQLLLTLKEDRERCLGAARVADFAAMLSLQQSQGDALRSTVERYARLMVRARFGMTSKPFVETQDSFGKVKQFMLRMLADPGHTPAKEQACKAADCCLAHLMQPTEGSVLHDMLQQGRTRDGSDVPEVLVAATLKTTVEEVRKLDKVFYMEHLDDWNEPDALEGDDPPPQPITQMGQTASSDTDHSPAQALPANADVARESLEDLARLKQQVQDLKQQVQEQERRLRVPRDPNLEAGGGLMYAMAHDSDSLRESLPDLTHQLQGNQRQIEVLSTHAASLAERMQRLETMSEASGSNGDINPQEADRSSTRRRRI